MPKNKDLKRLARTRMQKTGESYTTARARLLSKKNAPAEGPTAPSDLAALAGMSDEAVRAKTGRSWSQWVAVLDAVDAASLPHREIAEHLHRDHGVPGWWAQMVTVGYERIRGLREVGQRRGGTYDCNKSKTLPVPISELYRACHDAELRSRWIPGEPPTLRTATPDKSLRFSWPDGTAVQMYLTAKGEAKSQIAIQHGKLATKADAERMKAFWAKRLAALAEVLTTG